MKKNLGKSYRVACDNVTQRNALLSLIESNNWKCRCDEWRRRNLSHWLYILLYPDETFGYSAVSEWSDPWKRVNYLDDYTEIFTYVTSKIKVFEILMNVSTGDKVNIFSNGDVTYGCTKLICDDVEAIIKARKELMKENS